MPAAIVSDRHGEWHREAYHGIGAAERGWRGLGMNYASVMFVRDRALRWTVAKSYGLPGAIAAIEKRFHEEFVHELFPQSPLRPRAVVARPRAVVASTVPDVSAAFASAPPPPPDTAPHPPATVVSDANPF